MNASNRPWIQQESPNAEMWIIDGVYAVAMTLIAIEFSR